MVGVTGFAPARPMRCCTHLGHRSPSPARLLVSPHPPHRCRNLIRGKIEEPPRVSKRAAGCFGIQPLLRYATCLSRSNGRDDCTYLYPSAALATSCSFTSRLSADRMRVGASHVVCKRHSSENENDRFMILSIDYPLSERSSFTVSPRSAMHS